MLTQMTDVVMDVAPSSGNDRITSNSGSPICMSLKFCTIRPCNVDLNTVPLQEDLAWPVEIPAASPQAFTPTTHAPVIPPASSNQLPTDLYLEAKYGLHRTAFHDMLQQSYGTGYRAVWSARIVNSLAQAEGVQFRGMNVAPGSKNKCLWLARWLGITESTCNKNRVVLCKVQRTAAHLAELGKESLLDTKGSRDKAICNLLVDEGLQPVTSKVAQYTFPELLSILEPYRLVGCSLCVVQGPTNLLLSQAWDKSRRAANV
jgi:hypothetical protein